MYASGTKYNFNIICSFFLMLAFFAIQNPSVYAQQSLKNEVEALIEAGNLNTAGKKLLEVVRGDPENKEAYLLLARVYYAKGRLKKCYKSLEKSDRNFLTPKNAFFWGACYFSAKKWKEAVRGFSKVSENSRYRPFANYYLGVCFFRIKQYYRAKTYLTDADSTRLPLRIQKNRGRLLEVIQKRQDEMIASAIESSSMISNSRDSETMMTEPEDKKTSEDLFKFQTPDSETDDGSHEKGLRWQITPSLLLLQSNKTVENHSLVRFQAGLTAHRESIGLGLLLGRQKLSKKNLLKFSIGVGHREYDVTESSEQLFSLEGTSGSFIEKKSQRDIQKIADLRTSLAWSYEARENFYIDTKLSFFSNFIDHEGKKNWSLGRLRLDLAYLTETFLVRPYVESRQQSDQERSEKLQETILGAALKLDLEFFNILIDFSNLSTQEFYIHDNIYQFIFLPSEFRQSYGEKRLQKIAADVQVPTAIGTFGLVTQAENRVFDESVTFVRSDPYDPIEANATNLLRYKLKYSAEVLTDLIVSGFYQGLQSSSYKVAELDDFEGLVETETKVAGTAYGVNAQISVFDWLKIKGNYEISSSSYQAAEDVELEESFLNNNPDFSSQSSFIFILQKSF